MRGAHHTHIPTYGGDADAVACGVSLGWATIIGAGRLVTANHYATDTLLAVAIGLTSGWVLPLALHYGFSGERSTASSTGALRSFHRRRFEVPVFEWQGRFEL